MTRSDPAYEFFVKDARDKGFTVLADYFRHYGIVPPANYGRPAFKDRELPAHDSLERMSQLKTWTDQYAITTSWGEPGPTILVNKTAEEGDDDD